MRLSASTRPASPALATLLIMFSMIGVMLLSLAFQSNAAATTETPPAPTTIPTLDPAALTLAQTGVSHNADWTPLIQSFNGVDMVLVPAGCFMMGSTDQQIDATLAMCEAANVPCERSWFADEQPVAKQCFSTPFWIDRYEVTNAQFSQLGGQATRSSASTGDNHPRERITWAEASQFCTLRDARLPTENEWEYAARGPDSLLYPWGDQFVSENAVYLGNSDEGAAEVGSRPDGISWVGAYDLSGNVSEWVSSLYIPYPYTSEDGRESDEEGNRVLRGGSWLFFEGFARASHRGGHDPNAMNTDLGFRCAFSLDEATTPAP